MGGRFKSDDRVKSVAPAPGIYEPSLHYTKETAPGYKMSTSQRKPTYDLRNAEMVPGTGAYTLESMAFNYVKPKFHMGVKLSYDVS